MRKRTSGDPLQTVRKALRKPVTQMSEFIDLGFILVSKCSIRRGDGQGLPGGRVADQKTCIGALGAPNAGFAHSVEDGGVAGGWGAGSDLLAVTSVLEGFVLRSLCFT